VCGIHSFLSFVQLARPSMPPAARVAAMDVLYEAFTCVSLPLHIGLAASSPTLTQRRTCAYGCVCVCVCLCVSLVSFVPFLSTSAGAATFRANAALTRKHLDKIVRCCVAQCVRLVRDGTPAM